MATVDYAPNVLANLRDWGRTAVRIGVKDRFLQAIREMDERLRTDPENWGDPIRDFSHLHLTWYCRYGLDLVVSYSVHIDGTPVFVHHVELRPGTDLYYAT